MHTITRFGIIGMTVLATGCASQEQDNVGSTSSELMATEPRVPTLPPLSSVNIDKVRLYRHLSTGRYETGLSFKHCVITPTTDSLTATVDIQNNFFLNPGKPPIRSINRSTSTVLRSANLSVLIAEASAGAVTEVRRGGTDGDTAYVRVEDAGSDPYSPYDNSRTIALRAEGAYTATNSSPAADKINRFIVETCGF